MANKVVVHLFDHQLLKGFTYDFSPNREVFHIFTTDSSGTQKSHEVKLDSIKAVFFVKDFDGDKDYVPKEDEEVKPVIGKKLKIEFFDGEILRGISQTYRPELKGFFMFPFDSGDNVIRAYVRFSSTKTIEVISS